MSAMEALWAAGNGLRGICGHRLPPVGVVAHRNQVPTFEHVFPRHPFACDLGRISFLRQFTHPTHRTVAAHARCNRKKSNRVPTACEVIFLAAVQLRMGMMQPQRTEEERRIKKNQKGYRRRKRRRAEVWVLVAEMIYGVSPP